MLQKAAIAGIREREFWEMTWREWSHLLYAYEYNRQVEANNYRMLYALHANLNRPKGRAPAKPEKIWPLPLIDGEGRGYEIDNDTEEHRKLREFYQKYQKKHVNK